MKNFIGVKAVKSAWPNIYHGDAGIDKQVDQVAVQHTSWDNGLCFGTWFDESLAEGIKHRGLQGISSHLRSLAISMMIYNCILPMDAY